MEAEHSKGKDPNQTKPNIRRRITRTAAVAENDDNDAFNSNNFSIQRQVLPTAKTTTTTTTTHWQFILAAFCGGDFMLLYRKNFLIVVADRLRRTEQSFSRIHNKGQQQPKKAKSIHRYEFNSPTLPTQASWKLSRTAGGRHLIPTS